MAKNFWYRDLLFWATNGRYFRHDFTDQKTRRISEADYVSAYEALHNY